MKVYIWEMYNYVHICGYLKFKISAPKKINKEIFIWYCIYKLFLSNGFRESDFWNSDNSVLDILNSIHMESTKPVKDHINDYPYQVCSQLVLEKKIEMQLEAHLSVCHCPCYSYTVCVQSSTNLEKNKLIDEKKKNFGRKYLSLIERRTLFY